MITHGGYSLINIIHINSAKIRKTLSTQERRKIVGLGICLKIQCAHIEQGNSSAMVEHEATTTRIGDDQIFLCNQRGINTEDAVSMIVNGFCKEVFRELPMEFAVEAQKLLGISLEGSVG